ncbi:MAG: cation:proton antiporter, partial [Muribaculaceae bacterium]|nr:cation:proton antiporter [Muribaculaceae bacterium]
MNISIEILLLAGSLLLLFSILLSKTGYRFGVPTLLMFLLAGMMFGTDGAGIEFDDVHTAQDIGMAALCIILFSGGLDTKIKAIRPVLWPGLSLSTAGVLLTTLITGAFVWLISGSVGAGVTFTPVTAMLLAATMSSTDSASVFNILRSQKIMLKHRLGPMLELESGSNDPMAYLLTIILI